MLIETTIHIHKNILEVLNRGAARTGRTRTFIIKLLMQRVMRDNQKIIQTNSRIKYQARDAKESWQRLHVVMNEYEYEYYLDMRKFYKMSVSFILAFSVMRYIDEVMNELLNDNNITDNYCYQNYIFIKKIIDGVICWQIYWGLPQKTNNLLNSLPAETYNR
jgi:hypothetical protein